MTDTNVFDNLIKKIDTKLVDWERVKRVHSLTAELIAEGTEILKEAKNARDN